MPGTSSIMELMRSQNALVARTICDGMFGSLQGYRRLTGAEQHTLFDEVNVAMGLTQDHLAAGRPIPGAELDLYHRQGFHRGSTGFPFNDLVAAFHVSSVTVHRMMWQAASPETYPQLFGIQDWSARQTPRIIDALTGGYMSALQEHGNQEPARKLLTQQLLEGKPAAQAAAALGVNLAPSYLVLRSAVAQPLPTEGIARVKDCLQSTPGTFYDCQQQSTTILIPVNGPATQAQSLATQLAASLQHIAGQPLLAAQSLACTVAGIPAAVAETTHVLTLLAAIPGPASRPYTIDELLVEHAISQNTDVIKRLAGQLAPLDTGTELVSTLEKLYANDLDRERTAQVLHIHRRTLTYRLSRIRALCGIDPSTSHGIALLRAALTAKRMLA